MTGSIKRELELKRTLVGQEAASRFIAALGARAHEEINQINHIFDTDELHLNKARYAVRLRVEPKQTLLTAKGPSRDLSASATSKAEAEVNLEKSLADQILAGSADPVSILRKRISDPYYEEFWSGLDQARGTRPLKLWGTFETLRRKLPMTLPSGLRTNVEVDTTSFPGGRVDHEVELELPDESLIEEGEAWLEATAQAAQVQTGTATPKIARFFAALKKPGL